MGVNFGDKDVDMTLNEDKCYNAYDLELMLHVVYTFIYIFH